MDEGIDTLLAQVSRLMWREFDARARRIGSMVSVPLLMIGVGYAVSIGAGTGPERSIHTAQYANGNWVEATRRMPVCITVDGKSSRPLIAGLSTHVVIDTRN